MSDDKYNIKRKIILQELDKGHDVSILELGMYDLTPYFDNNKFDVSLSEAIMLNKNSERKIKHINQDLFFSPPQYKALEYLFKNNRVVLSTPTSFGKTLLIKEYIYLKQPKHVVYIVPTNALAYELEKSFKENEKFNNYTIFDKCKSVEDYNSVLLENKKLFFIGTQEKFLEIDKTLFGKIDLFVIDEAYKLHESVKYQRAYKLSETFLDSVSDSSEKVFLLTPKANFTGFEKYNFAFYESTFNAVEKNYIVLRNEDFFETLLKKGTREKTILFCSNPGQINHSYNEIKSVISNEKVTKFSKQLETDIHPDWSVVKLLKSGILTHHGQMPKYVQNRMINLFNESDEYKILFGTNSISEGINTSTKNLFIYPKYDNWDNLLLLKNTIGRAGRLGKYPMGYIYSVVEIEEKAENEIEISLAISNDEDLAEIKDTKDIEKIKKFSYDYEIDFEFCEELLRNYKLSLSKLKNILDALKKDCNWAGINNLPFIASSAFRKEYTGIVSNDKVLIKGYLQTFYKDKDTKEKVYLSTYNNMVKYFKEKSDDLNSNNTDIINYYMQFIYSTLEYCIMPIVNIGLEIREKHENWSFGKNVIKSLEECKSKYYQKTFGNLNIDELKESHRNILNAMKDYGMTASLKSITIDILEEIESYLNVRYSTIDVLRAVQKLSTTSNIDKNYYKELISKYM